jgi:iron complex transport system substrate-binding protein
LADRALPVPSRGATQPATTFVALLAALCTACTPASDAPAADAPGSDAPRSVTDDAGRTVSLREPARRVISLIPAQTEAVALLAGPDVLIARTAWDLDPRLQHLPSIGNALTPSIEWLAAQRPDLVIAWPDAQSRDVVKRLSDVGIPVYASRVESVAEIRTMLRRLGVLLGAEQRADSVIAAVDAQLDSVRAAVADRPRPSVMYLLNADPPMIAGPGTFVDELLGVAGGTNVFGDVAQLWPQVSLEEIVRRQPDVIIRPSEAALASPLSGLAGRPGWRELRAVQAGRVYAVDPYFYNRPGASVGAAARGLAAAIHSDSAVIRSDSAAIHSDSAVIRSDSAVR